MNARKRWTALLAAGVLATAAACGGESGDSGEGDGGKVTLRFTWWGDPGRHEYTEKLSDLFEKKNPNIKISREPTDWDSYYDTLNTKLASGDAPDVINVEIRALSEYGSRGVFADLSGKVNAADLDKQLLTTGQVGGTQVAIPTGANVWSVFANTKVLGDANVETPDDKSWTWDDYVALSAEITKRTADGVYGTEYTFNPAYLEVFAAQRGEDLYGDDKLVVSAKTVEDWFGRFKRLIDTKGSPDAAKSQEIGQNSIDSALVSTNKGAFGMWWSNQLGTATEGSGEAVELLRLPKAEGASTGGMFLQPTMFWAVNAESEHPEEAAKVVDFLVNDPEAGEILLSDRGLPMNSKIREAIDDKLEDADKKSLAFIDEISGELDDPPSGLPRGASEVPDILQRYGEEFAAGKMSASEAARKFLDEANGALG